MGNTSAQEQGQVLQGECHGQENSLMRKPSLLFHLASLMALNGSSYNQQQIFVYFPLLHCLYHKIVKGTFDRLIYFDRLD